MVQIQEAVPSKMISSDRDSRPQFKYIPISVKRKAIYGNTMTLSQGTLQQLLIGNNTLPLGYESHDVGLARYAP